MSTHHREAGEELRTDADGIQAGKGVCQINKCEWRSMHAAESDTASHHKFTKYAGAVIDMCFIYKGIISSIRNSGYNHKEKIYADNQQILYNQNIPRAQLDYSTHLPHGFRWYV